MARYADRLLSEGEEVVLRTRQHPLATIIEARWPWLLFIGSFVLLILSQGMGDGQLRTIVGYVVLGGFVISLLWLVKIYWTWLSQDYIITNRRVVKVEGIINKRSADSSLEKINDAILSQSVWGRIFNFGNLEILTASDQAVDRYYMLNAPKQFKKVMLTQKHALETDYAYGRPPSPPLRASTESPAPQPVEPQMAAPALTPAPVPVPQPTTDSAQAPAHIAPAATESAAADADFPSTRAADEDEESVRVTETLARLADLRDQGAITAEEYEQKKDELLGRL